MEMDIENKSSREQRYREALETILHHGEDGTCNAITPYDCIETIQEIARAALEKSDET